MINLEIFLIDKNPILCEAWRGVFKGIATVVNDDILKYKADAIVSPANSFGFMDGGIDLAYSNYFGWDLQDRLQEAIKIHKNGELLVGDSLFITTNNDAIPWLISAPTMRFPQVVSGTMNAYLAFRAVLLQIKYFNYGISNSQIRSVLCPGLGTGVGFLDEYACAEQMRLAYKRVVETPDYFPSSLSEVF